MKTLLTIATFILVGMTITGFVTYFELHGIEHHEKYNGIFEYMLESVFYAGGMFLTWAFMTKQDRESEF